MQPSERRVICLSLQKVEPAECKVCSKPADATPRHQDEHNPTQHATTEHQTHKVRVLQTSHNSLADLSTDSYAQHASSCQPFTCMLEILAQFSGLSNPLINTQAEHAVAVNVHTCQNDLHNKSTALTAVLLGCWLSQSKTLHHVYSAPRANKKLTGSQKSSQQLGRQEPSLLS